MGQLISIIIPVYNVSLYLGTCIESILIQTYKNIEIILVDDGSTDGCGDLCEEFKQKDDRIFVIHKNNGGLSDARNVGIDYAHGDYIMFVDSDDVVAPNYVECLYSYLTKHNADISICDPYHTQKQNMCKFSAVNYCKVYDAESAIKEMLYQKSFLVAAWGKLYKKRCFDHIRFPKGMLFEDSAVMYKVFATCSLIVYTPSKLYGYVHREGSITTSQFSRKDLDILVICDQIDKYMLRMNKELQKAADYYFVNAAIRVYLGAVEIDGYNDVISECEQIIKEKGKWVLVDCNVRIKTKVALVLYFWCKPLLRSIHKKIDRWK